MLARKLRLKVTKDKTKLLVKLAVEDTKKLLNKRYEEEVAELNHKHREHEDMLKIRNESKLRVLRHELKDLKEAKSNLQQSYYKTQKIADNLKGAIITLGTLVDTQFEVNTHNLQRFKNTYDSALKNLKDLSGVSLVQYKHND